MKHSEFISVLSSLKAVENSVRILTLEGSKYIEGEIAYTTTYTLLSNAIPLQYFLKDFYNGGMSFDQMIISILAHIQKISDMLGEIYFNPWFEEQFVNDLIYKIGDTEGILKKLLWKWEKEKEISRHQSSDPDIPF
ncbi:hypothetical protein [Fictibacillus halophilus]|uniref:hypothetical protein n=1 Tax=Fictibacillus halophilus TaxID=1610490 RepID=UPI001CFAE9D6|nr:hypothetical protein [Fictibacillus halophilus]